MSYQNHNDQLEVQFTTREITLEQLDLRNRQFHHLHDDVIASKVSRILRTLFMREEDEYSS